MTTNTTSYKKVAARITVEQFNYLKGYAERNGISYNFLIRKAIDYWTSDLNGRTLKDAATERMLKGLIDLDEVERWCGLLDQRPVY